MVNMYSRVEGMLYSHYKRKKRIDSLKSRLIRIENRIERLRRDIKECNIDLEDTMKAIDYSRDSIQSSGVTSNIERELERAVDRMLREIENNIREKYKTKDKIINLEKQVENVELLLDKLTEEELQIVELKYGEKINYRSMETLIPMGKSTIQRKHQEIIYYLIDEIK